MPFLFLTEVRDEKSDVYCRAAEETRSSTERNVARPATVEGFLQLAPDQRFEIIEMVERFATKSGDPSLS
jgi:hypothetical protein